MSENVDPEAAAEWATKAEADPEAAGEMAGGHMAAEGVGGPEEPFWWKALRNKHPNPPISEVGDLRDIRDNWEAYGLRGLEKAAGVDDAEAWIDLTKFVVGAVLQLQAKRSGSAGGSKTAPSKRPEPENTVGQIDE